MGVRMAGISVVSMEPHENLRRLFNIRVCLFVGASAIFISNLGFRSNWVILAGWVVYACAIGTMGYEWFLKRRAQRRARQNIMSFMERPEGGKMLTAAAILAASIRDEMYVGGPDEVDHLAVEANVVNGELRDAKVIMPTLVPGSIESVAIVDGLLTVQIIDHEDRSLKWRIMEIARERIPGIEVSFT